MMNKKVTALLICLAIFFSFSACGKGESFNLVEEKTTVIAEEESETANVGAEEVSGVSEEVSLENAEETTANESTAVLHNDPSAWSKAEIAEFYKNAAKKSNAKTKSEQVISLADISINNGQFESGMKVVKSIIGTFLNKNSTEIDGITGGYVNLSEADIKTAKAYKIGNNTAIEMVMNNQTDGAKGDALAGSVGHVVSVVGDITVVTTQLQDMGLPIEISEKDTKIYYTNAVVKVIIDPNGNIVKGTWRYTVDINLNNYHVAGTKIDTTSVVMDNVITVNGGFDN